MEYLEFLAHKRRMFGGIGIDPSTVRLPEMLFDWQAALVRWALRKGRAALFADTGLGKTLCQVAWADALGVRTLILAPLCVAEQTITEARKIGVTVRFARNDSQATGARIVITNYEHLKDQCPEHYGAVVLDESSILKAYDGVTRTALIRAFSRTPYRLCCTATPSPNDIAELANHAEFLGMMTRPEFLATWFVRVQAGHRTVEHHGWRMKRHAIAPFYRWMTSWAMALKRPSDLGYRDDGFILPPLRVHESEVQAGVVAGVLFPELGLSGLSGRLAARRGALADRVANIAAIVARPGQWLVWCALNTEAAAIAAAIPDAVNVQGCDSYADKVGAIQSFAGGKFRVLVSKVRILGYGLNLQHCHQMVFCGLSDSWEQYYQAIRRCWRFGQRCAVDVHIVVSEAERGIVRNVRAKEARAQALSCELLRHALECEREELCAPKQEPDGASSRAIASM